MGRARKTNDKRELIMNAAIRAFARRGYHKARISDVAGEAGVAAGTNWFTSIFLRCRSMLIWQQSSNSNSAKAVIS
jgi:DNA-binding transcriptional regulator YbjK